MPEARSSTRGCRSDPSIFVDIAGEIDLSLGATNLLYLAAIFVIIDLSLFLVSQRIFHREKILTRWK